MIKNNVRDYAVSAFRYYSEMKRKGRLGTLPADGVIASGCLLDIAAVEKTLRMLESVGEGKDVVSALEMVYFTMPGRKIKKGEISGRVMEAAQNLHIGEATVYRLLNKAIIIFARNRGLRIAP